MPTARRCTIVLWIVERDNVIGTEKLLQADSGR